MTRSDLVDELAERFGQLTHRDTEFAVKTILDAMSDALARGHRIEIRGFGSFSINRRPPRVGRNPRSRRAGRRSPRSWCRTSSRARRCARRSTQRVGRDAHGAEASSERAGARAGSGATP